MDATDEAPHAERTPELTRRSVMVLGPTIIAALLAGCGSSDDGNDAGSTSPTTTRPTASDLQHLVGTWSITRGDRSSGPTPDASLVVSANHTWTWAFRWDQGVSTYSGTWDLADDGSLRIELTENALKQNRARHGGFANTGPYVVTAANLDTAADLFAQIIAARNASKDAEPRFERLLPTLVSSSKPVASVEQLAARSLIMLRGWTGSTASSAALFAVEPSPNTVRVWQEDELDQLATDAGAHPTFVYTRT